jgi:hypothetical protein
MTEYLSSGAWWLMKLIQGVSALVGGISMAILWLPKRLMTHGKVVGVMLAGGISALAGVALTGGIATYLEADTRNLDAIIGISLLVGACWVALLNLAANSFRKRESQTLEEAVDQIRGRAPSKSVSSKSAPAKKPSAKKAPGKRVVRKVLNK